MAVVASHPPPPKKKKNNIIRSLRRNKADNNIRTMRNQGRTEKVMSWVRGGGYLEKKQFFWFYPTKKPKKSHARGGEKMKDFFFKLI